MARQIIDTSPPTGDPAPTAFNKANANFSELYLRTAAGAELGYAEIASSWSTTSSSPVDVPGLQLNFIAGLQPVSFAFGATVTNTTEAAFIRCHLYLDGSQVGELTVSGRVGYITVNRQVRLSGLNLGQQYQLTVKVSAISGGTATIYASSTERAYVQAVTI